MCGPNETCRLEALAMKALENANTPQRVSEIIHSLHKVLNKAQTKYGIITLHGDNG